MLVAHISRESCLQNVSPWWCFLRGVRVVLSFAAGHFLIVFVSFLAMSIELNTLDDVGNSDAFAQNLDQMDFEQYQTA